MNRTALVLAFGFTLTAVACGGSDDTSTDATGANGTGAAGMAGTAGAGGGGTAGSGGAGNAGTGGTAGSGGAMAGSGGTAGGDGGSGGSVGGKAGTGGAGGALSCPASASPGAPCTKTCTYAKSCDTKTVCSCTTSGTFACATESTGGNCGGSGGAPAGPCPVAGSPCSPSLECIWSGSVTICDAGVAWRGADTGAKAEATCDPTGAWKLTYGQPSNNGFCTKPATPPWLQVKKAPSGKLVGEFAEGSPVSIDAATCTIKASHSFTVSNPSESWTANTSATLKVAGDTATGDYTLSNLGFCKGMATGLLSATRE